MKATEVKNKPVGEKITMLGVVLTLPIGIVIGIGTLVATGDTSVALQSGGMVSGILFAITIIGIFLPF